LEVFQVVLVTSIPMNFTISHLVYYRQPLFIRNPVNASALSLYLNLRYAPDSDFPNISDTIYMPVGVDYANNLPSFSLAISHSSIRASVNVGK
jgi:hypothetical protein